MVREFTFDQEEHSITNQILYKPNGSVRWLTMGTYNPRIKTTQKPEEN